MATNYTTLWSAVAASFSAISAVLVMLIQRRNLIESVRPDLIPFDWTRYERGEGEYKHEVIKFNKTRNVGRGAAFNVFINGRKPIREGNLTTQYIPGRRLPAIGPNETVVVEGEIYVWWKHIPVAKDYGTKDCFVSLYMDYTDAREIHYSTLYCAFARPLDAETASYDDLAPHLSWDSRTTVRTPVWRVNMTRGFRRIWRRIRKVSRRAD